MNTNELTFFRFEEMELRSILIENEPYFVAKDVAEILGYSETAMMTRRLDSDEKTNLPFQQSGSNYQTNLTVINESGLYNVIIGSNKPEAKKFKKWVTSEVLPSIRKTGGYLAPTIDFTDPDNIMRLLENWKADREKLELAKKELTEQKPKVAFFEAVTNSKDAIDMASCAKVLDMGIGRNLLFKFLQGENILMKDNTPYQKYIDMGLFRVIEQEYRAPSGEVKISLKTLVYQKGLDYIRRVYSDFIKEENE